MSISLEVAAALSRAKSVTDDDVTEWRQISAAAIKMGLFDRVATFSAFHQTAENIAYCIFMHTVQQYATEVIPDEPSDDFFVFADAMSEIMHAVSVGSGVHPDITEAYVTCLVDTRMEALLHHIRNC